MSKVLVPAESKIGQYISFLLVAAVFIRGGGEVGIDSFTFPQFISVALVLLLAASLLILRAGLEDVVVLSLISSSLFVIEVINSGRPNLSVKILLIGLVHLFLSSIPLRIRWGVFKGYVLLSFIVFLHDIYVRLTFSSIGFDFVLLFSGLLQGEAWIYGPAKFGSKFFYDSNFSAVLPLVVGLILLVQAKDLKSAVALFLVSLFFVALSLSRSAIFVYCFLAALVLWRLTSSRAKIILVAVSFLPILLLMNFLLGYISDDESWLTKVEVMHVLSSKVFTLDVFEILFGSGVSEGRYVFGYADGASAHLLIPTVVGQVGVVGLCIYIAFWVWLIRKKMQSWLGFLVMMMLGVSVVDPFDLHIFLPFALAAVGGHLRGGGDSAVLGVVRFRS